MIHSLFLINASGDIFLEKHWKSVVSRSVCDYFFEAQERASEAENVPPVIPTPHHYLLSVYRHKIFFVAVIQSEVPPLFVIEFLHRVVDTFQVRGGGGPRRRLQPRGRLAGACEVRRGAPASLPCCEGGRGGGEKGALQVSSSSFSFSCLVILILHLQGPTVGLDGLRWLGVYSSG